MVIRELPTQVANQIAAGEVVERPASVIKELVENAIDAQATEIMIRIEESGLRLIEVTDNGIGMDHEDMKLAFKRHATSKIYDHNDLFRIKTLGFRGEALPSIASVSEVYMASSNGDIGHEMTFYAGELIEEKQSHLRQGTSIRVENLFYNTPARLKYIKSLQTELSHITDIINREALSHPDIRFIYYHEEKKILETNGKGKVHEVLAAIYGFRQARQMLPIQGENLDFKVEGYVSNPTLTRASKTYLSLFVNERYIKNYALNQAIIKGYGSKLMVGRYPIAAIYITLDAQLIDVNVHPTKQEVRISNEEDLYRLIQESIASALLPVQRIPENQSHWSDDAQDVPDYINETIGHYKEPKLEQSTFDFSIHEDNESVKTSSQRFETAADRTWQAPPDSLSDIQEKISVDEIVTEDDNVSSTSIKTDEHLQVINSERAEYIPEAHDDTVWKTVEQVKAIDANTPANHFPELYYAGQVQGTYLACYNADGMYLVDQHAAQERIKYEYYRDVIVEYGSAMQTVFIPYVLEFTQDEKMKLLELRSKLEDMGIYLEDFGATSFIIQKHPIWMGNKDVQNIIEELIVLLLKDPQATVKDYREATAIMMSCKRSIKANHYLSPQEANQLLNDLAQTKNPYNCPHGRPVLVHFSNYEIERMFKRIQDPHESTK